MKFRRTPADMRHLLVRVSSLAAYSAAAAFNVSANPTVRRALYSLRCLKQVASPSSSATPPAGLVAGFSRHTNICTPHPCCYKAKRDWFRLNIARFLWHYDVSIFIDNYPASDTASVTNTSACGPLAEWSAEPMNLPGQILQRR